MKVMLIAVAAATLAYVPAVGAQNLAEYANSAARSTALPSAAARPSRIDTERTGSKSPEVTKSTGKQAPSRAKNAQRTSPAVSNLAFRAVFVLSNGEHLESSHYLLTVDSLRVLQGATERLIPLSALDLDATIAANDERGIDVEIPKNKAQITLGF